MSNQNEHLHIVRHPLVVEALTGLRKQTTTPEEFRHTMRRLSKFLAYEATASLATELEEVLTPLNLKAQGQAIKDSTVAVPILRAGLGMVDGFLEVLPSANVGFIGLARDEETLLPSEYYCKVPPCNGKAVFVLDPMLATGGSACKAISEIVRQEPKSITLVTIISSPEGVEAVHRDFPDVMIVTATLDDGLNDVGYIVPGLGDAGDRLCGTIG